MNAPISVSRPSGMVLVFSLIILLILAIVGVFAMLSVGTQERMAGSVNVQAVAFQAASAGVGEALEFGIGEWRENSCRRGDGWIGEWSVEREIEPPAGHVHGLAARYRLRAECREDSAFLDVTEGEGAAPAAPVQMFVTSLGVVTAGGEELSRREIEVRIDDFRADGRGAIHIEGQAPVFFQAPNSDRFSVDGTGGPAISTSTEYNAGRVSDAIGGGRIGNYHGGVTATEFDPPWSDPALLGEFASKIKVYLAAVNDPASAHLPRPSYPAGDCRAGVLTSDYERGLLDEFLADLAELGAPAMAGVGDVLDFDLATLLRPPDGDVSNRTNFFGIQYVEGELTAGGNPQGVGLVIVEGRLRWHGNAVFRGMVLALGGDFDFRGGGNEETEGTIFVTHLNLPSIRDDRDQVLLERILDGGPFDYASPVFYSDDPALDPGFGAIPFGTLEFGSSNVDLRGGGNHTVTYDCRKVDAQRVVLKCFGLDPPWASWDCDTPGEGGSIQAIRSWREKSWVGGG